MQIQKNIASIVNVNNISIAANHIDCLLDEKSNIKSENIIIAKTLIPNHVIGIKKPSYQSKLTCVITPEKITNTS